jgi:hypothetical protein
VRTCAPRAEVGASPTGRALFGRRPEAEVRELIGAPVFTVRALDGGRAYAALVGREAARGGWAADRGRSSPTTLRSNLTPAGVAALCAKTPGAFRPVSALGGRATTFGTVGCSGAGVAPRILYNRAVRGVIPRPLCPPSAGGAL